MKPEPESRRGGVLLGFLTGMGIHVICIPALVFLVYGVERLFLHGQQNEIAFYTTLVMFLPGIAQVVYMVPAYRFASRRGAHANFLKGFVLSSTLLFLLNAGYCGIMPFLY